VIADTAEVTYENHTEEHGVVVLRQHKTKRLEGMRGGYAATSKPVPEAAADGAVQQRQRPQRQGSRSRSEELERAETRYGKVT
jgi:hypothetical protein